MLDSTMFGWLTILLAVVAITYGTPSLPGHSRNDLSNGTCLVDGDVYEAGQEIPVVDGDGCLRCYCSPNRLTQPEVSCVSTMCTYPMCVDRELDDRGCCLICPNGENCLHEGEVLSATEEVTYDLQGGRKVTCSCPRSIRDYITHGTETQAYCSITSD